MKQTLNTLKNWGKPKVVGKLKKRNFPLTTFNCQLLLIVLLLFCTSFKAYGADVYEIWNWADLAYLNVMLQEPGQVEWNSYGKKAVLMQNLVHPDDVGTGSDGHNGGAGGITDCDYLPAERQLGCYGYENWDGSGAFAPATDGSGLLAGKHGIPLGRNAWHIDINDSEGWIPIGNVTARFAGRFDGQGFTVNELWIGRTAGSNQGLFGYAQGAAGNLAVIENLGVNISSNELIGFNYVGGLVGCAGYLAIANCYATGVVEALSGNGVGGLAGYVEYSTITHSYATCEVTGNGNNVGGLVGDAKLNSMIAYCYATGSVTGTYGNNVGGLAGRISMSAISSCYATGAVTGKGNEVGGLVGYAEVVSSITNSYASGSVTGTASDVGGLLGYAYNIVIDKCYASGVVDVIGVELEHNNVGGLVGYAYYVTIINSFAFNPRISIEGGINSFGRIAAGYVGEHIYDVLENNYALECMTIIGELSTPDEMLADNQNGANITTGEATSENAYQYANPAENWDFTHLWTFDYDGNDITVADGTNLPVLLAFHQTGFPNSIQSPLIECTTDFTLLSDWERLRQAINDPDVDTVVIYEKGATEEEELLLDGTYILVLQDEEDFIESNGIPIEIDGDVRIESGNPDNPIILYTPGEENKNTRHFRITDDAAIEIDNVILDGNGNGGGIETGPGTDVTILGAEIHNCVTDDNGGAILAEGDLWLENLTISGSEAGGNGGGVYLSGEATIINCTFSNNTATGEGGGIYAKDIQSRTILFSTFNGNSSGIYFENAANQTINGNIIYGNGTEINLVPETANYNVIRNKDLSSAGTGNQNIPAGNAADIFAVVTNSAADKALLADNGGPAPTFKIKKGGLAHNAVPMGWGVTGDQRGFPRPEGSGYDAGSVELQPGELGAEDFAVSTKPGTPVDIPVADTDDLTVVADPETRLPAHGRGTVSKKSGGTITYTPHTELGQESWEGIDEFDYEIEDPDTGIRYRGRVYVVVLDDNRMTCDDEEIVLTMAPGVSYNWFEEETGGTAIPDSHPALTVERMDDAPFYADRWLAVGTGTASKLFDNRIRVRTRFVPLAMKWNPVSGSNDWNDPENWTNWTSPNGKSVNPFPSNLGFVPWECTDVLIPDGLNDYPDLTDGTTNRVTENGRADGEPVCNDIWFEHGGEVVRTDLLNYQKAHVELDLQSNRWYMFSAPLQQLYTGDIYLTEPCPFDDKVVIYTQLFNAMNPEHKNTGAEWTGNFNTAGHLMTAGSGVSVWADDGSDFNASADVLMPVANREPAIFANGFGFWFPKPDTYYQYYYAGTNEPTGDETGTLDRTDSHRFIYEPYEDTPSGNFIIPMGTVSNGEMIMVGNPFMAHLDFEKFFEVNSDKIQQEYKLIQGFHPALEGDFPVFQTYKKDESTGVVTDPDHLGHWIAPMQSVILTAKAGFTHLTFHGDMTVSSPGGKLRAGNAPEAVTITARMGSQMNTASLLYSPGASNSFVPGEDSYKLYTGKMDEYLNTTPLAVYTFSSDGFPLEVNTFGETDRSIGLGIRTSLTGEIELEFTGIEHFVPGRKIFFHDLEKNVMIDLMETPGYTFTKASDNMELNDRFLLIFYGMSGICDIQTDHSIIICTEGKHLRVISNNGLLQSVQVFDLQGRLIQETSPLSQTFSTTISRQGTYIIKVQHENSRELNKIITIQ